MKTKIFLLLFCLFNKANAKLTSPENHNEIIVVQGTLKKSQDGFDLIVNKNVEIKIKHSDLLKNNKTEPDLLFKRTSFKINIKDIQDIRNL